MLAIIPARGGSKEIKNKNIYPLAGKPLISYAIECAQRSKYIKRIIVSTDSERISLVANTYGAEVIIRPKEISQDDTPSEEALWHVLCSIKEKPESFIFMQCTSPFTSSQDLDNAIELFYKERAQCVFSVTKFKGFIWSQNTYGLTLNTCYDSMRPMRQERNKFFKETGAFYIINTQSFLKTRERMTGKTLMYEVSKERSLDIDTMEDVKYAEFLMSQCSI